MIIGIGTDLLEIDRIRRTLDGPAGARFMEKLLTPSEREQAEERKGRLAEFVAGRFAAKEAVSKAFGCGIGRYVTFHDIEVLAEENGRPACIISAASLERLGLPETVRVHLSITHSETMAAAYAIAERIE